MKVLLSSIGTRGDMEPFLAVGQMLKKQGYEVVCTMPEQFAPLVHATGLQFRSLGPEFIDMLDSDDGRKAMGGGGGSRLEKIVALVRLARMGPKVNGVMIKRQRLIFEEERPDIVVCNGKSTYPFIWEIEGRHLGIKRPKPTILLPIPYMHYVKGHAHLAINRNLGTPLNRMTYWLANAGLIQSVMSSIKNLSLEKPIKRREVKEVIQNGESIYTISPSLFPRPHDWPSNLHIFGYHERDIKSDWQPTKALEAFLSSSDKIVFFTFGSMTNPRPVTITHLLMNACKSNGITAVFNTASGGLVEPEEYDHSQFYFTDRVPYSWIFPKIYAVVHHGGSGTTHTALKYGCASMIIPHIIDQFAWNGIVASKGAGPKGPSMAKIQRKPQIMEPVVAELLSELLTFESYKQKAVKIGQSIQEENLKEKLISQIVTQG